MNTLAEFNSYSRHKLHTRKPGLGEVFLLVFRRTDRVFCFSFQQLTNIKGLEGRFNPSLLDRRADPLSIPAVTGTFNLCSCLYHANLCRVCVGLCVRARFTVFPGGKSPRDGVSDRRCYR